MGAGLYIPKLYEACKSAHEDEFSAACQRRDYAYAKAGMGWRREGDPEPATDLAEKTEWTIKAEQAQRDVETAYDAMYAEGYFRDSYNATSVLWQMGLSWWNDVIPMLNGKGNLTGDNLREFLKMLEERPINITLKDLRVKLKEGHATVDRGENSPRVWRDYFIQKRLDLIAFVKVAIKRRNVIHCSL